ncbi:putative anion transporter [Dorcoceras hygrometricum]|uniref:Putative anion transporter n=1 Tax=Dorcoceras hygrometricum TaxID=472368 RepID=A0A2Z7C109_9LAMI|nr:putative anion transporter [Dorcoceras hygrometricum]
MLQINAMKCMRAIKDRIARPVNQLENHLNRASIPRTANQPLEIIDTTTQSITTPMIALDLSGATHQSSGHNVALNQVKIPESQPKLYKLKAVRSTHPRADKSCVGDPDPPPGQAAEEQKFKACYLAGTRAWLQPVFQEPGASRLIAVVTSIRSTTRFETPSSDCTRSPDEISTIGFSTKN